MKIYKSEIVDLWGSWGSGVCKVTLKDVGTDIVRDVPAENPTFIRALASAYGGISPGHSFDVDSVRGKVIYWGYDDMGLLMAGFVPEDEATDQIIAIYDNS